MTKVAGSLLGGMQHLTNLGYKIGVVVVDEQSDHGTGSFLETGDQQAVLAFAASVGYPVWLVELNPNPTTDPNLPTHTRLKALLPNATPVVTKSTLNAFSSTNLHQLLKAEQIRAFVLMGFRTDCCCEMTAVGGLAHPSDTVPEKGGTQLGYWVLSCQKVLRGGEAEWQDKPGVRFYERV